MKRLLRWTAMALLLLMVVMVFNAWRVATPKPVVTPYQPELDGAAMARRLQRTRDPDLESDRCQDPGWIDSSNCMRCSKRSSRVCIPNSNTR